MKAHLATKNGTVYGRHSHLGANRTKELFILKPSDFARNFKINKNNCCELCVKEYNKIVILR